MELRLGVMTDRKGLVAAAAELLVFVALVWIEDSTTTSLFLRRDREIHHRAETRS